MATRKILWGTAISLIFSLAFDNCAGHGDHLPPVATDLSQPGPYQTGVTTLTLYDTSRPTMANGTYPGDGTRTLVIEIRYPSASGGKDSPLDPDGVPYPLIVLSHGFMAQGRLYSYLTQHLASYGYVTAAPDFPLTSIACPGGPNPTDVINQPGDVSFVIDRMLDFSATPGNLLAGGVDPDHIGVTGHSLGGFTTMLVTFSPGYLDERIDASLPLAPMGCPFEEDAFRAHPIPMLLAGGTADIMVTFQKNLAQPYERASAPKYLLEITNGNHMGFSDFDFPEHLAFKTLFGLMEFTDETDQAMTDLLNSVGKADYCGPFSEMFNPDLVEVPETVLEPYLQRKMVKIYGTAFFEIYLKGKEEYKYFFTDEFAKTTPEAIIHKDN